MGSGGYINVPETSTNAETIFYKDVIYDSTRNSQIYSGTVIFAGSEKQTVSYLVAPNIIIENNSSNGVYFANPITVNTLFNHNGNNFTLYNEGIGSTFVDYDGDGKLDNVDPYPTDPNK